MKLWILKTVNDAAYGEYNGFVIRAADSRQARRLANKHAGTGNKPNFWLNPKETTCKRIEPSGEAEILLESFLGS